MICFLYTYHWLLTNRIRYATMVYQTEKDSLIKKEHLKSIKPSQ